MEERRATGLGETASVRFDAGLFFCWYVVALIMAGDDVKTIQQNAGHYSSAFMLDRYAHVTTTMQRESANRMEKFIAGL